MKNNGLIVTLIIILAIIVFVLVVFLVFCLRGGMSLSSFDSYNDSVILERTFDMEEVQYIEINQEAGDITFRETNNDYIQVVLYGKDDSNASVNISDNKLNVNYTIQKNFMFFSFGINKKDIVVYIPNNYSGTINIKNKYGKCEIIDLENAIVNIEADCRKCKAWKN
ncbi:MAG: DUF4097 domain-containing protein [Clostridia bacterium]|nr:DUF4097 domain-containing protein [Clostridia bacterium]